MPVKGSLERDIRPDFLTGVGWNGWCLARPLRIEYPGATYHVMARGNQGRSLFADGNGPLQPCRARPPQAERGRRAQSQESQVEAGHHSPKIRLNANILGLMLTLM